MLKGREPEHSVGNALAGMFLQSTVDPMRKPGTRKTPVSVPTGKAVVNVVGGTKDCRRPWSSKV